VGKSVDDYLPDYCIRKQKERKKESQDCVELQATL
jgi:hypothetical protein